MLKHLTFPLSSNLNPMAYYTEEGLFTTDEIDWILQNHNEVPFEDGKISDTAEEAHSIRKSKVKWLNYNQYPQFDWIYNRLQLAIERANNQFWDFSLYSMPDPIQYTEYYPSGGHYDWHMDIGPGSSMANRKISITVQLSHPDEYEGGNLQILRSPTPEDAPRGLGTVVIFPSYMMHRVTQVTSGVRKSLVLWVGGQCYK